MNCLQFSSPVCVPSFISSQPKTIWTSNIQHKQSNPHQKLSQTVRYEFSQKWRQLPPDEKEKYKVDPKVKEDCVGSEEAVELLSLNTRCSLERFRSVVSEFTDAQKVACEELGFGVLVRMAGKRLRKCTVRYLVECVDPTTCEIKIHGQTFKLSSHDFARVMGLRNAGRELSFAGSVKDNPELMGIAQQFRMKEGKSMMVLRDFVPYPLPTLQFNSEQIRKELTLMLIRNQNNSRWEAMLRNIKRFQKQRQTQKKQHTETNKQSEERGKNVTKLTQVKIEPTKSNHKGKQQVQGTVKPRTRKSNNRSVKRSRW